MGGGGPQNRGIERTVRMIVNPLSLGPLAFFPFSLLIVTCLERIAKESMIVEEFRVSAGSDSDTAHEPKLEY